MLRYNLAYLPSSEVFARHCIQYASSQFRDMAEGYLLESRHALPHMTICQFEAPESILPALWQAARKICTANRSLVFAGFYFRPGKNEHQHHTWTGLTVAPDAGLAAEQTGFATTLSEKFGLDPLTETGDNYSPHLTFARLKGRGRIEMKGLETAMFARNYPFYLSLGTCSANGVYLKKIYTVDARPS